MLSNQINRNSSHCIDTVWSFFFFLQNIGVGQMQTLLTIVNFVQIFEINFQFIPKLEHWKR